MQRYFDLPLGILDDRVAVHVATPESYDEPLFPEEEPFIAAAIPRRVREFKAGRASARRALSQVGVPPVPILRGKNRAPVWPPGYVGSISHTEGCCLAAVGARARLAALGVDVETREDLDDGHAILVCTEKEIQRFHVLDSRSRLPWRKIAFSAKESFYKCSNPNLGLFLDFKDIQVDFELHGDRVSGEFSVEPLLPHPELIKFSKATVGAWGVGRRHILTAALVPRPSSSYVEKVVRQR